ncbi:hypothetical protein H5410_048831 [Solanum commersonii]|uniref:Uncharacterized protein n=1 Tax=Solanum commersonii TaxID=4109 RepID=A0A9J5XKP9_SOLCO|nr:hypothetical protein H5410_048831 [Solanum commersonii]
MGPLYFSLSHRAFSFSFIVFHFVTYDVAFLGLIQLFGSSCYGSLTYVSCPFYQHIGPFNMDGDTGLP